MVSSIYTYDNLEQVQYEYDLNDNLIKVTDREGSETTYTYDAINRITEIHRPNGISTYNTYKARNQITELVNVCDDCEWVVSNYSYTYDNRGFITAETAIESLAGYAYDDKHDGRHTDGRHDDLYPHGTGHNGKHDKDAAFAYQIVQTDRTFTNDDAGKLLSSTETEDNYGTYTYTYEYDLMGNRTYMEKTAEDGTIALWCKYEYNESNQLVKECSFEKGQTTMLTYTYDADGNRILETEKLCGRYGTVCASVTRYRYDVENRLAAVQEQGRLLMAAAYDGDGNRVFQLNYNPEKESTYRCGTTHGEHRTDTCHDGHGESQGDEWKKDTHNRYDILFPVDDRSDRDHRGLIYDIHNTGKHSDYELIEYINDVNREYTEVLVENSFGGRTDTSYIYGVDRLSFDYENGCSGYYLYDPRGSVTGITNEQGRLVRSYRYDAFGNLTFGEPRYENEYTYNGESYNPNIESQYLRARYYDVVNGNFLTEDSYLGNINEPLTLNRYNYCVSSPLNYTDPSGMTVEDEIAKFVLKDSSVGVIDKVTEITKRVELYNKLNSVENPGANYLYVTRYDIKDKSLEQIIAEAEELNKKYDNYIDGEDLISGRMKVSEQGIDMIKEFELSYEYMVALDLGYFDEEGNLLGIYPHYVFKKKEEGKEIIYLSDGGITLGYGHWISEDLYDTKPLERSLIDTYANSASIIPEHVPTNGRATKVPESSYVPMRVLEKLLYSDMKNAENAVNDFLQENDITLEQHEFDVLVSFTHQYGAGRWKDKDRLMTKFIKEGHGTYDPKEVEWIFAQHEYEERRKKEAEVFIYGYK